MIMVIFDWPPKDLSPNARVHWAKKAGTARRYRRDCYLLARKAGATARGKVGLDILFNPPDRRHYDLDNLVARMKSGLDGLADALGVNDRDFSINTRIGQSRAPGTVTIHISAQ